MADPFLIEHSANWSRKSPGGRSQQYRAVLGIAVEVREVKCFFMFFCPGSRRSYLIPGIPCLAKEKSNVY